MSILSAEFVKSSAHWEECPKPNKAEYAFIGRSNVGKSSLINALCNRKSLAKISSTPGKTQLINTFLIDDAWFLTDLPGYGYAKVSKKDRKKFSSLIADYILNRKNLVLVFVLIDSRIPVQKNDLEFLRFLGKNQIPFSLVFTKIDKLNSSALSKNLMKYQRTLLNDWEFLPPIFKSSAVSKTGTKEIIDSILHLNTQLNGQFH